VSREREKAWTVRNGDRASGAFLFALSLYAAYEALQMQFGGVARPGPGFYPTLLALLLAGLSAAILVRSLRTRQDLHAVSFVARTRHIGITIVAIVFYAGVLEPIGFIPCTFALVLMLLVAIGKVPWRRSIVVAATGTVVFYLIFTWLGIPLPKGVLAF
jgi:putative tricarboxylic transport membrane protein